MNIKNRFIILAIIVLFMRGVTVHSTNIEISSAVECNIDLKAIGHDVLRQVLVYHLKTGNSIASTKSDHDVIGIIRKNTNDDHYDENGQCTIYLDDIYVSAKRAIKYHTANCGEYANICIMLLVKHQFGHPFQDLTIHLLAGNNFDHNFVAISRPSDDLQNWIVIDPWLRRVCPFHEISEHFEDAGFKIPDWGDFTFNKINIIGNYDPNIHDLSNIKTSSSNCETPKNTKKRFKLNNGYYVPYDGPDINFDPAIHEVFETIREDEKYALPKSAINKVLSCDELREDFLQFLGYKRPNARNGSEQNTTIPDHIVNKILDATLDDALKKSFLRFVKDNDPQY